MDIEVDGVPFVLRKVDVSATKQKSWDLSNVFATDEMIKVYCMESDPAMMRWSVRALEPQPGAILLRKDKVFEEAEATAKIFFEKQQVEQQKMLQNVQLEFDDPMEFLAEKPVDPSPQAPSAILGEDDDDDGGF
eukprot:symbB.v1.2.030839.t1/scaffold3409.1/size109594/7